VAWLDSRLGDSDDGFDGFLNELVTLPAMIDPALLSLIRCPIDSQPLEVASQPLCAALNQRIQQGQLRDQVDALVEEPLQGALVTRDATRAYPIREGIPTLIPTEAIPIPEELRPLLQPQAAGKHD
jgi:uncharacterized protein YbaR (Trm112 family)